ncbi:MAG: BrnT family toxin [Terracidiphilus sp.]
MEKAHSNFTKHGVRFEQACEVFFDPFVHMLDATAEVEARGCSGTDRRLDFALCSPRRSRERSDSNHLRAAGYARGEEAL